MSKYSTYQVQHGGKSEAASRLSNQSPAVHYMTSQLSTKHGYGQDEASDFQMSKVNLNTDINQAIQAIKKDRKLLNQV